MGDVMAYPPEVGKGDLPASFNIVNELEKHSHMSGSIDKLAEALAAAQGEMHNANLNKANPYYNSKYATLAEIRDTVIPVLAKHGLSVVQLPYVERPVDGPTVAGVTTIMMHSSGQWIRQKVGFRPMRSPKKGESVQPSDDPQSAGSAITYARRYHLAAFACISADEDDDGNLATHGRTRPNGNQVPEERFEEAAPAQEPPPAKPKRGRPPKKAEPPAADDNPPASNEEQTEIIELAGKMGYTKAQMDSAAKKYAKSTGDQMTADWASLHHKTATAIIDAIKTKLGEARAKKMKELQDVVEEHSISADQFRQIAGDVDTGTLAPEDIDALRVKLEEAYGQPNGGMQLGGDEV